MAKTRSVVFSDDFDKAVHNRAKEEDMKLSVFIKHALEAYMGLNPDLMKTAKKWSVALDCEPMTVVNNLAIYRLADLDAKREVYGPTEEVLHEFARSDETDLSGVELYKALKKIKIRDYEAQRIRG